MNIDTNEPKSIQIQIYQRVVQQNFRHCTKLNTFTWTVTLLYIEYLGICMENYC